MVKIHGNWCGPNWTDGKKQTARKHLLDGGKFNGPCIDKLDCACRTHDKECSGPRGCTYKADNNLITRADRILANPLNFVVNPVMYAKARLVRDTFEVVRFTRYDAP